MGENHGTVQSRLWRDGTLAEEDFPFELISDHLEEEGSLVWVDICDPDPERLNLLAEELTQTVVVNTSPNVLDLSSHG